MFVGAGVGTLLYKRTNYNAAETLAQNLTPIGENGDGVFVIGNPAYRSSTTMPAGSFTFRTDTPDTVTGDLCKRTITKKREEWSNVRWEAFINGAAFAGQLLKHGIMKKKIVEEVVPDDNLASGTILRTEGKWNYDSIDYIFDENYVNMPVINLEYIQNELYKSENKDTKQWAEYLNKKNIADAATQIGPEIIDSKIIEFIPRLPIAIQYHLTLDPKFNLSWSQLTDGSKVGVYRETVTTDEENITDIAACLKCLKDKSTCPI